MQIATVQTEIAQSRERGPLREIKIPPCPELLTRLRAAMALQEPDLSEVQAIASADVAMSATLLRVANSPVHLGDGAPCVSVGQAMTRLGLDATAELMTGFLVRNSIPVNSPHLQRFWERSSRRAMAMRLLVPKIPGLDPDIAPLFGLFCHVGMPVLLQSVRGYGATLVEAGARIDRPYVATENANHKTDHAVVGALVARVWGLPQPLMAAVRLHHDFTVLSDSQLEPGVAILVAAGLVADQMMRRAEGLKPDADWTQQGERVLDWLQISLTDVEEWTDQLAGIEEAY
ncbi:HD-like signal output (HDOD) protein [Inhella inkyongensis]|uniref:HD-like signal output (HDOD) protein n=1 Tax=Inhella inkyongensis TaxID=392593 RepID=A0A840S592_9BURK|nr:HDOD domain-containing protein [Inhella inkyongensis]MBB5203659.1 HD-like signal output (HDOD) protein [Inhella inkyongensis]